MKKDNFFNYLIESRKFIWIICIFFLISFLVGLFFPFFFEKQIIQFLSSLENQISGLNATDLVKFIFNNNVKASFFILLVGLFFGIFPLIMIAINGYLIGFVLHYAISAEGITIIWRLFPHGVFELPAIIISAGIGLKLGYTLILSLINKEKVFVLEDLKKSIWIFLLLIIPLLLFAAIIEGLLIYFMK